MEPAHPTKLPLFNPVVGRPWLILMFVVGPIVAYVAMLADGGNGWSPVTFLAFGIVAGVASEAWNVRGWTAPRRWGRRITSLCVIALVSVLAAAYSVREDAAAVFADAFGTPPPASVTHLRAWKQYYDGIDLVVAFDTDRATIDKLVQTRPKPFEPMEYLNVQAAAGTPADQRPLLDRSMLVFFLRLSRVQLRPLTRLAGWERNQLPSASPNMYTSDRLFWDAASGQAVLVHSWH